MGFPFSFFFFFFVFFVFFFFPPSSVLLLSRLAWVRYEPAGRGWAGTGERQARAPKFDSHAVLCSMYVCMYVCVCVCVCVYVCTART